MTFVPFYALLLGIRLFSLTLIGITIHKQRIILKRTVTDDVEADYLRRQMYILAISLVVFSIVPVYVDVAGMLGLDVMTHVIEVLYRLSYSLGFLVFSLIIWRIYRDVLKEVER